MIGDFTDRYNVSIVPPVWLLRYWDISAPLSVILNAFGIYIILNFSTPGMHAYRWIQMNILVMTFIVDIFMTVILRPVSLFPLWGGFPVGLGSAIHPESCRVVLPLTNFFFCGTMVAINHGFLYRWFALRPGWWLMRKKNRVLKVFFAHQLCLALCAALLIHFTFIPREEREEYIRHKYPHLQHIITLRSWDIFNTDISPKNSLIFICATFWFLVFMVICGVSFWQINRILRETKSIISEKTAKMHRQLTYVLIVQTSVPFILYVIPIFVMMITVYLDIWGIQELGNFLMAVVSAHSNLNVILMAIFIKPYRIGSMETLSSIRETILDLVCFNHSARRASRVSVTQYDITMPRRKSEFPTNTPRKTSIFPPTPPRRESEPGAKYSEKSKHVTFVM